MAAGLNGASVLSLSLYRPKDFSKGWGKQRTVTIGESKNASHTKLEIGFREKGTLA